MNQLLHNSVRTPWLGFSVIGRSVFYICIAVLSLMSTAFAKGVESPIYRDQIRGLDPMRTLGLDSRLASILEDYYEYNFTDSATWDKVQSMRFEGVLRTVEGAIRFTAYKKKPDYCKIVLFRGVKPVLVVAYDGEDAWRMDLSKPDEPVLLPEAEALNFIRDSTTGGHLFYPQLSGKTIELKGLALVEGQRCFELLVTLPNGQRITSMLDMVSFQECQQITENAATGKQEVVTHKEFRDYEGIRLPVRSVLTIDDEFVHTVEMKEVRFDLGVTSWMFSRSSGADLPNAEVANRQVDSAPSVGTFSIEPSRGQLDGALSGHSFSPFAQPSAFDVPIVEMPSFVDHIGKAP